MLDAFENPANQHREVIGRRPWLWALLFGPFYWAAKGIWPHFFINWLVWPWGAFAFLSVILWPLQLLVSSSPKGKKAAPVDFDLSYLAFMAIMLLVALIYAGQARSILRRHYGRLGWRRVLPPPAIPATRQRRA